MSMSATATASVPTETSFLTGERILLMNNMSAILAGISLLFCLAVLVVVAVLFTDPHSRKALDRLSFRLLTYALISNCIYSIGYIICVKVSPGVTAGVWLIQFWLGVTNWLILCIAVNLQIVLVHSLNSLVLEKYYIIGTICLNLVITLPPLIKGKFGWDPVIEVCWLTSHNPHDRLTWQISTQLFWILLAVVVTTASALTTMGYLYKHKFVSEKALQGTKEDKQLRPHTPTTSLPRLDAHGKPIVDDKMHIPRSASKLASRTLSATSRFRNIIMRISLYPIVMVVLNLVITIADIRISTASGIYSQGDYSLYVVYYALYGARGIFYAMIAIIDPSILRGIRVWRGLHSAAMSSVSDDNYDFTVGGGIISVQAEITRLAEELGIYDAERKSGASSPLAPLTPAVTRPGQFSVPARRIETNIEGGSDPESPPPQQGQQQRQEEDQDERLPEGGGRKSSSAEAAEEDRVVEEGRVGVVEEVRRRRKQDRSARLEAEKLVKRQI
ncbi:unnamed protein product [Tuber melanosporum]|uniref:(Perigord truffle) hypothetical protein n=1 Tax=Tuber melanosporum (strain Mel28) TaxID=656061 RepID=D5G475_TUBMM|nr:uncharacterized protein GSTUM_00003980001 [Tuber melanosporum]CAZ79318.1 unnamed protein product [Tuber melanosporum]